MVVRKTLLPALALGCGLAAPACGGTASSGGEVVGGVDIAFLAVDEVNVVWTLAPATDGGNGAIELVPKQDPTAAPLEIGAGREVLASGGLVHWVDAGGAVWQRDAGGTVTQLFQDAVGGGVQDRGLARDAGHLFQALALTAPAPGWEIWSIPLDGTPPVRLAGETGDSLPFGMASDGVNLYFALAPASPPSAPGEIRVVPVTGGDVTTLVDDGMSRPQQIALGPDGLYWTSAAAALDQPGMPTGRIFVVPKAGGTAVEMADLWGDGQLTIDGPALYWAGPTEGFRVALARIPIDGSDPSTLAVTPGTTAGAVAADTSSIYWSFWDASGGQGGLLRTPR
jgi:hypothetical protein